jgi:nonsense-mediated mRNA decay protein 3
MDYVPINLAVVEHKILCCQCGVAITPNPSNMCVACIRTQVDITADIPKQVAIYFCRFCERYLNPPAYWVTCTLESRELMALCLKRLKNLSKVKLIDANFVWTEPHSKRIKVKLTIQGEVMAGTILQQTFVVEYVVNSQMCDDCRRVEAKDTWNASVQLRQKTIQRKTLYFLEQTLLKYDATKDCVGIKAHHGK